MLLQYSVINEGKNISIVLLIISKIDEACFFVFAFYFFFILLLLLFFFFLAFCKISETMFMNLQLIPRQF